MDENRRIQIMAKALCAVPFEPSNEQERRYYNRIRRYSALKGRWDKAREHGEYAVYKSVGERLGVILRQQIWEDGVRRGIR